MDTSALSDGTYEKIVLCLPNLQEGGAARVAAVLCSTWVEQGHEVHIVTFESPEMKSIYPLNEGVRQHRLGLFTSKAGIGSFLVTNARRSLLLRNKLRELNPSVVFGFLHLGNIISVAAAQGLNIPVLISERNHPGFDLMSRPKALLRKIMYPRATKVCVQTEPIRQWFREHLDIDCAVIENPIWNTSGASRAEPSPERTKRRMISLGRLEPQKGFDRLIEAFARANAENSDWELVIHGEGPQRNELEQLIEKHALGGDVFLPGVTYDPNGALADADLYVHSARYEGFPNAVMEALAAGRCVVATDCPGATRDILKNGEYGILCADAGPDELAEGMLKAMNDPALRAKFEASAHASIAHLDRKKIAQQWIDLVRACRAS